MMHFNKKEMARKLNVKEPTITKYSLLFEKEGYEFITDGVNNERLYTDKDLENFKEVIALKKVMKVEEAIRRTVKGSEVTLYNPVTPESMDNKLDVILEELRFIKDENKAVKEELAVIKEEVAEYKTINGDRDLKLMELIRGLQETKQALIETAVAKEPKKKWYQFWK